MKTKSTSQITPKLSRKLILLAIIALALCASHDSRGDADCLLLGTWDNVGTGDWFDPLNWGPSHNQVPDCGECCLHPWEVDINDGGTAQISGLAQTARACETFLGKDSGQSGNLSLDHGTLDQCSLMWVGYDGKGTLNITNGGLVTTLIGGFIGAHPGSNGSVTVDGANPDGRKSTWTVTGGPAGLYVGGTDGSAGGTALLTVTNEGRVNAANVHVWNSGTLTGNGTVTTTNGTTTNDGTLAPSGTLTINGNLSFGQFANMRCNVSSTSVDNAQVSGTAALNGKLSVTLNGFFTGNFTLLHASTLNNQFSSYSFTYTGCLSPSIRYVDGDVILHVESSCQ